MLKKFLVLCIMVMLAATSFTSALAAENSVGVVTAESTKDVVYVRTDAKLCDFQTGQGSSPYVHENVNAVNGVITLKGDLSKGWQCKNIEMTSESPIWAPLKGDHTWIVDAGNPDADAAQAPVAATPPTAIPAAPAAAPQAKQMSDGGVYNLNGENGVYLDCGMWRVDPQAKEMVWTGGGSWVHVCQNREAQQLLLDGYTATFTTTVEGKVRACRSYWTGEDNNGNIMNEYVPAQCAIFTLRPGTYHVTGWATDLACGVQVGFRSVPVDTAPWNETPTCAPDTPGCIWPWPIAQTNPTYRDPQPQKLEISMNGGSAPAKVEEPTAEAPAAPTAEEASAPAVALDAKENDAAIVAGIVEELNGKTQDMISTTILIVIGIVCVAVLAVIFFGAIWLVVLLIKKIEKSLKAETPVATKKALIETPTAAPVVETPAAKPALKEETPVVKEPAPKVEAPAVETKVPQVEVPVAPQPVPAEKPAPVAKTPAVAPLASIVEKTRRLRREAETASEDLTKDLMNLNLTILQISMLMERFPTKETLASASVSAIRNIGKMGKKKAQDVYDYAHK